MIGYHIQATDGEIGHVEDFTVDDRDWSLRFLIVDTRNWLPGRKVSLSPAWAESINWADQQVAVRVSRAVVKGSPEYNPAAPVNRRYEEQLYDYYGRPRYWH